MFMSNLNSFLPGKKDEKDAEIAELRKRVDSLRSALEKDQDTDVAPEPEPAKNKLVSGWKDKEEHVEPVHEAKKAKGLSKLMPRLAKDKASEASTKRDESETDFTDDEKQAIFDKRTKGKRYTRRERKMLLNREKDGLRGTQWLIVGLALIGLAFVFFLYQTSSTANSWVVIVVIMLGSMMFLPAGMILGWAILDPYVRCKLLRRMTKRNYGIVNFVGKGNKMVSKIKNFDDALIWIKNKVWVITREQIYQLTKHGDDIVEGNHIEPDNIISLIETVPVLFVDMDSMQPLSLAREGREAINPEELGSTLKSWADNQLAKAIMLKKTMDIYFVIMIICSIASCFIGYIIYTRIDDMMTELANIKGQLSAITDMLKTAPLP